MAAAAVAPYERRGHPLTPSPLREAAFSRGVGRGGDRADSRGGGGALPPLPRRPHRSRRALLQAAGCTLGGRHGLPSEHAPTGGGFGADQ